jgi:4-hydroxythreonine-4-phosphate dehydrogenase
MSVPAERSGRSRRPRLALTLGDVAGVGPEIVVRAALDPSVQRAVQPIVVGNAEVVRRAARLVQTDAPVTVIAAPEEADSFEKPGLVCWDVGPSDAAEVPPATVDPRAGRAAYAALIAAIDAALAGRIDGIVTAPLNKLALHLAGNDVPGHTEILAERCGAKEHAMMLHLPPDGSLSQPFGLSVAHVTLHTSIASVPGLLTPSKIVETARLVHEFVLRLGCQRPRIGVSALNPHAGEAGLFGDEEARIIAPAVACAMQAGLQVAGPFPADTLFKRAAVDAEFDGIVAMYHDQGHIAFKLLGFHRAVNVTLGLPIIRTSPSQGTAFDIAWQGKARADGMISAIQTAARLCLSRSTTSRT